MTTHEISNQGIGDYLSLVIDVTTQIRLTEDELIETLLKGKNNHVFIQKLLAKKREQLDSLRPAGFEHAPQSALEFLEQLENDNAVEKVKKLKGLVSYNADGTMNIIPIFKIFCADIGGEHKRLNFFDAQKFAEEYGYNLIMNYPDASFGFSQITSRFDLSGDNEEYNGDEIFRVMSGCNDTYWMGNLDKKPVEGEAITACYRSLTNRMLLDSTDTTDVTHAVCGIRDMVE